MCPLDSSQGRFLGLDSSYARICRSSDKAIVRMYLDTVYRPHTISFAAQVTAHSRHI
ncbi:hypothetical protein PCCS19_35430 [Paenibacillus sp. CCS19]|nr:hypothetical protein PCCS19_35430 [Paenibacillus cellulosilyticus]